MYLRIGDYLYLLIHDGLRVQHETLDDLVYMQQLIFDLVHSLIQCFELFRHCGRRVVDENTRREVQYGLRIMKVNE